MDTLTEAKKRTSQRTQILNALRKAGEKGLTNIELQEISLRWQARLQELYVQGYKVALENLGDGIYNYVLIHEPAAILPTPLRALDVLISEIESKLDGRVTSAQLKYLLASNHLHVCRKAGTFNV